MNGDPIIIIPCGTKKSILPRPAHSFYLGSYHSACRAWAFSVSGKENIFVLSGKYGLVGMNEMLSPYDMEIGSLNCVRVIEVIEQAKTLKIEESKKVIGLGGEWYQWMIYNVWKNAKFPFAKMSGMGYQIQKMKNQRGIITENEAAATRSSERNK